MKPTIELVYFQGCPNVGQARANLGQALGQVGDAAWVEWDLDNEETPTRVRGFSSPAVLVDGEHVLGEAKTAESARSCSVHGAPSASAIGAAIGVGR